MHISSPYAQVLNSPGFRRVLWIIISVLVLGGVQEMLTRSSLVRINKSLLPGVSILQVSAVSFPDYSFLCPSLYKHAMDKFAL
jgi:hypothetical protein